MITTETKTICEVFAVEAIVDFTYDDDGTTLIKSTAATITKISDLGEVELQKLIAGAPDEHKEVVIETHVDDRDEIHLTIKPWVEVE